MPSNHLILCRPLLLPPSIFLLLPSIFPSIRVFSNESVLHMRWPKYWSLSFSISPPNERSGWISLRIDWFDLLAVQGTLKSLLQHHSSKAGRTIQVTVKFKTLSKYITQEPSHASFKILYLLFFLNWSYESSVTFLFLKEPRIRS